MAGISEVGAAEVDVKSYKCSIKEVTVSTKWKAPDKEVDEEVSTKVYDSESKIQKDIYIVTSQKGKKVTIKTNRDAGECRRDEHKRYTMAWTEFKKDGEGNQKQVDKVQLSPFNMTTSKVNVQGLAIAATKDAMLSAALPVLIPYNLLRTPLKVNEEIKNETIQTVKCFEIGGAFDALQYWNLPIPIEKSYITKFSYATCKEGPFQFQVISYPDISFKLEFTLDSAQRDKNDKSLNPFNKKFDWCRPKFEISTTYNAKKCKLELKIDLNKDADDYVYFKYIENNTVVTELGSGIIQQLPKFIYNAKNFFKVVKKICTHEFIQEFLAFDASKFKKEPKWELIPPSIKFEVTSKYNTSRDLAQIGKYYNLTLSCDPLIGLKYKLDLLYIILNAVTGGAATGVYLLVKNIKPIIEELLGDDLDSPVSADVFIDLEISGKINASLQYIIDTIKSNAGSNKLSLTPVEGVIDVDLKAGAKASITFFFIATAAAEASMTASSGITLQVGFENHLKEKKGIVVPVTMLFNGLKIKWCVKASAGLKKTKITKESYVGVEKEGEKKVWDKKEIFSRDFTFFKDDGKSSAGGGGGGGR